MPGHPIFFLLVLASLLPGGADAAGLQAAFLELDSNLVLLYNYEKISNTKVNKNYIMNSSIPRF